MNRLKDRHLEPGRGRVWKLPYGPWIADYRSPTGALYGAWEASPADAHNWIRTKAMEATE